MRKLFKTLICILLLFSILVPVFPAYAESQESNTVNSASESYDIQSLTQAIDLRDIEYLIRYYVSVAKPYYLEHGLDADFPYFNADRYLELYEDVRNLTGGDRKAALLHYLEAGIFEGRISGTESDPRTVIQKYPRILIVYSVRAYENDPLRFVDAIFCAYRDYENAAGTQDTQQIDPNVNRSFTMLYLASPGDDKDVGEAFWTRNIARSLLGTYMSDGQFNLVFMIGGNKTWYPEFLQNDLGASNNGGSYKNAIYYVDRSALYDAVEDIIATDGCTLDDIVKKVENCTNPANWMAAETVINRLVTENVLVKIKDVGSFYNPETLTDFINEAKAQYPADNYGLIIGGHGGGINTGSPLSAINGPDAALGTLKIEDTARALQDAHVDEEPFSILIYDSCLMGSSEVANRLYPYYTYLYGAETVSFRGALNYTDYFQFVSDVRNDDDVAGLIAAKAFDMIYQKHLTMNGCDRAAAIFDSAKTDEAMSRLNDVAIKINGLIADASDENKTALYNSMKLAAICSYQLSTDKNRPSSYSYLDLRDFLIKLKTALPLTSTSDNVLLDAIQNLCADGGEIDIAISAADDITKSNSFMNRSIYVYRNIEGEVNAEEITPNLWNRFFEYELCGASVYFPYQALLYTILHSDLDPVRYGTDMSKYLDHYINQFNKNTHNEYLNYKGYGYDDYISLVSDYTKFIFSKDEFSRILNLANALSGRADTDDVQYATFKDLINVEFCNSTPDSPVPENAYISITAKDYPTDTGAKISSSDSTGNIIMDMIDSIDTVKLYLTKYLYCNVDGNLNTNIDTFIGCYNVCYDDLTAKYHSESDDTSRLFTIAASNFSRVKLTCIEGYRNSSIPDEMAIDWVIPAEISNREKTSVIQALRPDETINNLNNFSVFGGNYVDSEGTCSDSVCYHVFDNQKKYIGTVKTEDGLKQKADSLKVISFYHYVARNNGGTDEITYLEQIGNITNKNLDLIIFEVEDKPLTFSETELAYSGQKYQDFGYIVSVKGIMTEYGQTVSPMIFNELDTDTNTYKATLFEGANYSSPEYIVPSDEEWEEIPYDAEQDEEICLLPDNANNLNEPANEMVNTDNSDGDNFSAVNVLSETDVTEPEATVVFENDAA